MGRREKEGSKEKRKVWEGEKKGGKGGEKKGRGRKCKDKRKKRNKLCRENGRLPRRKEEDGAVASPVGLTEVARTAPQLPHAESVQLLIAMPPQHPLRRLLSLVSDVSGQIFGGLASPR